MWGLKNANGERIRADYSPFLETGMQFCFIHSRNHISIPQSQFKHWAREGKQKILHQFLSSPNSGSRSTLIILQAKTRGSLIGTFNSLRWVGRCPRSFFVLRSFASRLLRDRGWFFFSFKDLLAIQIMDFSLGAGFTVNIYDV